MPTTALKNKVTTISEIQIVLEENLKTLFASDLLENNIYRIKIDIPKIDIIQWFKQQQSTEKLFWSDRDNKFSIAGIHFADVLRNGEEQTHPELFKTIQSRLKNTDESIRYFGGIKFDSTAAISESWNVFGTAAFILPRFELIKRKDSYQFVCNIICPEDIEYQETIYSQLAQLNFNSKVEINYNNELISRSDFPEREQWMDRVNNALTEMNLGRYEKIVLARKTELTFKENIRPDEVMHKLLENKSNRFHFCFQLSATNAFLGATPERLYYRNNNTLKCEAVAGTRSRGDNEPHDRSLADELLQSKKDIKEHRYVIDSILEALKSYVIENEEQNGGNVLLIQLTKVQHLIKRFKFRLHDSVTDFDLVNSLHPTAAVGGYPKNDIFTQIAELEQFDRGWYAAPVGWISKYTSEFAVAIRSGLIDKNKMTLYSGAGIIDGSIPESEWDEIENKISNFLKILSS